MRTVDIVIAGGGLSGLYAAWLLERQGIGNYVLLEARDSPGGRIRSFDVPGGPGGFDLGPAWFWPDVQPELDRVVSELGLARFAQHEQGAMVFERSPAEAPMCVPGYASAPPAMRLHGGMDALIAALRAGTDARCAVTGQQVCRACRNGRHVDIDSAGAGGEVTTWRAAHLLLAIPPRLAEQRIAFEPALPQDVSRQWRETATWMAPHAKYIAVYDRPFWRELGLSGEARSAVGVLGEIHDASMPGGGAALFGFFRYPAQARSQIPDQVLRAHCRTQLGRLFGPQGASPVADAIQDWAREPYTATALDLTPDTPQAHHARPPMPGAADGAWRGCLTGIASEWSPRFPGYLAGAIEAAAIGIDLLSRQERKT